MDAKTLFLVCALSLPMGSAKNRYDVGLWRYLSKAHFALHKKELVNETGKTKEDHLRVYQIGGRDDVLWSFAKELFRIWRLTTDPTMPLDVIGKPKAVPFERETAFLVLYFLPVSPEHPWEAMKLWSQAVRPLVRGGFIAFPCSKARIFAAFARFQGWIEQPTTWYGMTIWQKPGQRFRHFFIPEIERYSA